MYTYITYLFSSTSMKSNLSLLTLIIILHLVTLSCGGISSENCTYFQSSGQEVGQCRIKICPCSDNICQLRLDFQTFVIQGPSTGKKKFF